MDLITDHRELLKKFDDTRNELFEVENNYRILNPHVGRFDSKCYIPYEKDPKILYKHVSSKEIVYNQKPKFNDFSESSEESICEEEVQRKKVYLKSAVIAKGRNCTRKDVINKQNLNHKVRSRNCRILGMLQSTLQKFQDDAVKRQPQDMKRKKLEQKVEAAKEAEKRRLKKEKAELLLKMKEKKLQLEYLQKMMVITESFESWKCNTKYLLSFIITETKPHICYLPLAHTPSSKKQLEKSRTAVKKNILRQEEAVKMELAKITDSYYVPVRSNKILKDFQFKTEKMLL